MNKARVERFLSTIPDRSHLWWVEGGATPGAPVPGSGHWGAPWGLEILSFLIWVVVKRWRLRKESSEASAYHTDVRLQSFL